MSTQSLTYRVNVKEAINKLGNVNHLTDNLTDSNAIDHQLPSLINSIGFLIDTVLQTKAIKNKNII